MGALGQVWAGPAGCRHRLGGVSALGASESAYDSGTRHCRSVPESARPGPGSGRLKGTLGESEINCIQTRRMVVTRLSQAIRQWIYCRGRCTGPCSACSACTAGAGRPLCRHRLRAVAAARPPGRHAAAGGVAMGRGGDCAGSGPALRGFMMQRQDAGSAAAPRPPPDPFQMGNWR